VIRASQAYARGGWKAVPVSAGGRPKGSGVCCLLRRARNSMADSGRTPDQLKMSYACGRAAVGELVEARYGICLKVRNVGKYLKRWGYTPQKPLKKAYEQSPAAVGKCSMSNTSDRRTRQQEGAQIHWGDESGLRSDDVRGRGYAPKGQTPVLRVNARRESLSVISTVPTKARCAGRYSPAL